MGNTKEGKRERNKLRETPSEVRKGGLANEGTGKHEATSKKGAKSGETQDTGPKARNSGGKYRGQWGRKKNKRGSRLGWGGLHPEWKKYSK